MNVLLIGSGGREHAIAWKVAQSPLLGNFFALPGNPGIAAHAECLDLPVDDHAGIVRKCREKAIDLAIVGPEAPLAAGLADDLRAAGIRVFGPGRAAARIEASKVFAKHFMARHGIPTPQYAVFAKFSEAARYVERCEFPLVLKASGLAAGKGVILPGSKQEALEVLEAILVRREFGSAGEEVVIEERLSGPEVSLMAFCDGRGLVPMLPAQDHKRLLDGDRGPNTGGMGAYAPAPVCSPEMVEEVVETILQPAVSGLRCEGAPFVGVLYAGLMLTERGPQVLEFNCRFGDPETQAVLPLLESDLLAIALACAEGRLADLPVQWRSGAAACVVLATGDYPAKGTDGLPISGLEHLPAEVVCFHAGTRREGTQLVTAGGRVLGMTGRAESMAGAVRLAYEAATRVEFEGRQYRRDIAWQALGEVR
jgi:phosphoribosylamine--glycine ligase